MSPVRLCTWSLSFNSGQKCRYCWTSYNKVLTKEATKKFRKWERNISIYWDGVGVVKILTERKLINNLWGSQIPVIPRWRHKWIRCLSLWQRNNWTGPYHQRVQKWTDFGGWYHFLHHENKVNILVHNEKSPFIDKRTRPLGNKDAFWSQVKTENLWNLPAFLEILPRGMEESMKESSSWIIV